MKMQTFWNLLGATGLILLVGGVVFSLIMAINADYQREQKKIADCHAAGGTWARVYNDSSDGSERKCIKVIK